MNTRKWKFLVGGLGLLLLVACGGSGSSQLTAGIDGTGARVPVGVLSAGTVTGFGSVIVNGVRFDTSGASFSIDGQPGAQSDLSVGDVVIVRGELDDNDPSQGTASSVTFDDLVEGPIAAIDSAVGTITVLGQTINIDADTSFDVSIQPPTLDGLAVGDIVEVSGLAASDGTIAATRIELKVATLEFEVTGIVENHNSAISQFGINGQLVDYSSAMLSDFDDGTIDDGELVEVKAGTTFGAGGELLATRVEFKGNDVAGDDGDRLEIEGFISRFVDISDFDVSGFPVTSNGSPTVVGGVAADLGLDVKVEVEGNLNGGLLTATRIEIRRSSAIRLVANVDSVDAATNSFVVLGITIRVDNQTRIEDKSSQDLQTFSLSDLLVDDYVEIRGAELPAGSGEILASRLEREDDDPNVEIRGFVETGTVVDPSFSILGVTVTTIAGTVFRDAGNVAIPSSSFFANAEGRLVKADGLEVGDQAITATEVELE